MKTVVGLFDSFDDARMVVDELAQAGVQRDMIRLENDSKGESAFLGSDETTHGGAGALRGGLLNLGVPREDSDMYTEGVRRGGTLIIVTADDGMATRVYEIMAQHGSVDLEERSQVWLKSGWSGLGDTKMKTTQTATSRTTTGPEIRGRELKEGETKLEAVEEEMMVGKREVQKGGIRAYTRVNEVPVEEKISLREEHVHVERRPVDRPVTSADQMAFKEQTIEVRERSEEAVVSKQRRVVEEVVIGKDVGQRTETVRDTVRNTVVEVEQLGGKDVVTSGVRWETFDKDFRTHYTGLNLSDSSYDDYLPVYRYGYSLGTDQKYTGRDWSAIEPDARLHWEKRNPGTWEKFKDSVRYAWDRVTGSR